MDKNTDEYVAFLDVSTIPEDNWLEKTLGLINDKNLNGVLELQNISLKQVLKSVLLLPHLAKKFKNSSGAVFKRKFLQKVGYFLPNLKSGEDKEWANRCKQLDPNIYIKNDSEIYYGGIINKSFISLCRKWFNNYSNYAHDYSIEIERQRFIYLSFFSFNICNSTFLEQCSSILE